MSIPSQTHPPLSADTSLEPKERSNLCRNKTASQWQYRDGVAVTVPDITLAHSLLSCRTLLPLVISAFYATWGPSTTTLHGDHLLLQLGTLRFCIFQGPSAPIPFGEPLLPYLVGDLCFCTFRRASASESFGVPLFLYLLGSLCFRTFWGISASASCG